MLRYSLKPIVTLNFAYEISRNYATKVAYKLKDKAAKDHANDGTGKHTHVGTQHCTLSDCGSKTCPALYDQPTILKADGHNTHKVPVGRFCRFITEQDANGDNKPQYFIPTNIRMVMTKQEKNAYDKSFKLDPAQQSFVEQHKNKYE